MAVAKAAKAGRSGPSLFIPLKKKDAEAKPISRFQNKLRKLGVKTVRDLILLCGDRSRDSRRRAAACELLGEKKARSAVSQLLDIVENGEAKVSLAAARALSNISSKTATVRLCTIAQKSKSVIARQSALIALGRIGDPKSERVLVDILINANENPYIRGLSAQALSMLSLSSRAFKVLIHALWDREAEVRYSAICALSTTHGDRTSQAIRVIRARLNDRARLPGEGSVADLARVVLKTLETRVKRRANASRKIAPSRAKSLRCS